MKPSLLLALAAIAAAFVVGSTSAATAQTPTIRACVAPAYAPLPGALYLASSVPRCADDVSITWNQQGPAGPAGPAGPPGAAGAQGPAGSLSPAVASSIAAKLRQVALAEARLAKAKPGSAAERKALLALSRAQRQATAELLAALRA